MENVLTSSALTYDAGVPELCMEEPTVQSAKETRTPISGDNEARSPSRLRIRMSRNRVRLMFAEPKAGWREVQVRQRRTTTDWSYEVVRLLQVRYSEAARVSKFCDNLHTYKMGAFYEAFPADKARELVQRIEFRDARQAGS